MLDSWNEGIFSTIKDRLQSSAMKLVHSERNGEAFESQLVIGVRESYGTVDAVLFRFLFLPREYMYCTTSWCIQQVFR